MWVSGRPCWLRDPTQAFVAGTFLEMKNGKAVVQMVEGNNRECPADDLLARKLPARGRGGYVMPFKPVPDMDDLNPLNMAEVLENVDRLFHQGQSSNPGDGPAKIYSSVGPVLIAMNPFEWLKIYDEAWMNAYHDAANSPLLLQKLGPHAYRTSEEVYQCLNRNEQVAVVICGESGAGKTVTNGQMLRYLCQMAKAPGDSIGGDPDMIVEASSVLEAFGNARTTRNDNSSRFGRFTKLYFDGNKQVSGCGTTSYLLERSRIPGAAVDERNYHAFYMLIRGSQASKYQLKSDPAAYEYAKQGGEVEQPGVYAKSGDGADAADFTELMARMAKTGFDEDSLNTIFEAIAAVLHLGNVKIRGSVDSSSVDTTELAVVSKFLGVDAAQLAHALTHRTMKVGMDMITKDLKIDDALAMRDTVAKMIYNRIFDHVVDKIDTLLSGAGDVNHSAIGLLDIFGFEDMATNGFEQLFINSTNERIQHLFNTVMFEREKHQYLEEGIDVAFLQGPNNLECVHLCLGPEAGAIGMKKPNIVALLSDQVTSGKPDKDVDGEKFVTKLDRAFGDPKFGNEFYVKIGFKEVNSILTAKGLKKKGQSTDIQYQECFGIKHFAGLVMYTVQDFVPKSRDNLTDDLTKVLHASKKPTIAQIFADDVDAKDSKSQSTVGAKFRRQLSELAVTLDAGESRFVRCIKSNKDKVPGVCERPLVLEQLINGGVVDALEIRAKGLPDRRTYADFVEEFRVITYGKQDGLSVEQQTNQILSMLPKFWAGTFFKLGKTKIFMKTGVVDFLRKVESIKENRLASRIQRKLHFRRVLKIEEAWESLKEARADAESKGVHKVAKVKQVLDDAEKNIGPIYNDLMEAKKKHGAGQVTGHQANVAIYEKIEHELSQHKQAMSSMRVVAAGAQEIVDEFYGRKKDIQTAINTSASKAMETALALKQRVKLAREEANDCEAADKADIDACQAACSKADAHIEIVKKEIEGCRSKIAEALASVDIEVEPWEVPNPCPELDAKLAAAEKLVAETERLSFDVLKVQREFQKAMEALDEGISQSREQLDGLNEEAKQCGVQGLAEPYHKVMEAFKLSDRLDVIKAASKDPELYKQTSAEFAEAVKAASAVLEGAREELAKAARERAEKQELTEKLNQMNSDISEAIEATRKQIGKMVGGAVMPEDSIGSLQELFEQVTHLQGTASSTPIEEWKAQVTQLVNESADRMESVGNVLKRLQEQSKSNFARLRASFDAGKAEVDATKFDPPKRRHGLKGETTPTASLARQNSATMPSISEEPKAAAAPAAAPAQAAPAPSQEAPKVEAPKVEAPKVADPELMRIGTEQLKGMKTSELNKLARNLGADEDTRDRAMDEGKAAFIALIESLQKPAFNEQAERARLSAMRVGELSKLARELGVSEDDRDTALDSDDQRSAFLGFIIPLLKAATA